MSIGKKREMNTQWCCNHTQNPLLRFKEVLNEHWKAFGAFEILY